MTLTRTWNQTFSSLFTQPLLQTVLPYAVVGFAVFAPLNWVVHLNNPWFLPLFWVLSGALAALGCAIAKWVLVGKRKAGDTVAIWSIRIIMDSTWQAIRTSVGDYFMDMTSGSFWYVMWMKLMGSDVDMDRAVYVDSNGALLNPGED